MFSVGFELDEIVADIGFSNERAELRAEPKGIAFYVFIGANAFFGFIQNTRGFSQARAGRKPDNP